MNRVWWVCFWLKKKASYSFISVEILSMTLTDAQKNKLSLFVVKQTRLMVQNQNKQLNVLAQNRTKYYKLFPPKND